MSINPSRPEKFRRAATRLCSVPSIPVIDAQTGESSPVRCRSRSRIRTREREPAFGLEAGWGAASIQVSAPERIILTSAWSLRSLRLEVEMRSSWLVLSRGGLDTRLPRRHQGGHRTERLRDGGHRRRSHGLGSRGRSGAALLRDQGLERLYADTGALRNGAGRLPEATRRSLGLAALRIRGPGGGRLGARPMKSSRPALGAKLECSVILSRTLAHELQERSRLQPGRLPPPDGRHSSTGPLLGVRRLRPLAARPSRPARRGSPPASRHSLRAAARARRAAGAVRGDRP